MNNLGSGQKRVVKKEKLEGLTNSLELLNTKGITGEIVLSYVCFEHKGKHYRVKTVMETKTALGIL